MSPPAIQHQVRLPLSVALDVVLQGIRIRLGRSLVTLLGILLGIAFLMASLTGQAIRRGVSQETEARAELGRMLNFLVAETGPLDGRTLGVVQVGPLSGEERRFLERLAEQRVQALRWVALNAAAEPSPVPAAVRRPASLETVAQQASGVLVVGDGQPPQADWTAILEPARQKVIALTRPMPVPPAASGAAVVSLARAASPDERSEREAAALQETVRGRWIIVISLLVTVIGIANSMLMSVTERFREIGTIKCLGALSGFVRLMFLIESGLLGFAGSCLGALFGLSVSVSMFSVSYGWGLVMAALRPADMVLFFIVSVAAGVALSMAAAIYPANVASRMIPAVALKSNV